jgi:hypothetical protein
MSRSKTLDREADNALRMMNDAGFRIKDTIRFVVDEKLPFMGYTIYREQAFNRRCRKSLEVRHDRGTIDP